MSVNVTRKVIQLNNTSLDALERAVAVAEGLQPDVGYDVLLAAAKRFIRASRGPQPCPTCGSYIQGAHFCPGRSGSGIAYPGGGGMPWRNPGVGGIEYWYNQPTAIGGHTQHASVGQAQAPTLGELSRIEAKTND